MGATFTVTVEPAGQRLTCRADQTILDACLREGVWLPHACTHGTCGTCKATVLDGEVDHGEASGFALMDFERDEGATLLCCARPRSDVVIEADVEEVEGVAVRPVRDWDGLVASVTDAGPGVRKVLIHLDVPMAFNAGQYVRLWLPDGSGSRPYSLANPPSEPDRLELHVRRLPGGRCSDGWVFNGLGTGDRVRLSGPFGRFSYRPARAEPALLLAGGTGLAPIKSIARHVVEGGLGQDLTIYHGVGTPADLYDGEDMTALERASGGTAAFRPAFSRQAPDGRTGRVPERLLLDFERCSGHVAYVCGSSGFVEATVKALMRQRLFPRDIFREDFFDAATQPSAVRSPLIRR